eukprot:COSAG06_NODE_47354_length_339_cov_3.237500_2_plen_34_part_01
MGKVENDVFCAGTHTLRRLVYRLRAACYVRSTAV